MFRVIVDTLIKQAKINAMGFYTSLQKKLNKLTTPTQPQNLIYSEILYSTNTPAIQDNRDNRDIQKMNISLPWLPAAEPV